VLKSTTQTLNNDLLLHTYIIFSNVLCQAPNHDRIVGYLIFIIVTVCISRGIPTYPGHVTAKSNNTFCVWTSCCGLGCIKILQQCAKNQFQLLYLDQSTGGARRVLRYLVTSSCRAQIVLCCLLLTKQKKNTSLQDMCTIIQHCLQTENHRFPQSWSWNSTQCTTLCVSYFLSIQI
jgi:hypothetical protein